jgi:hypothetical protein
MQRRITFRNGSSILVNDTEYSQYGSRDEQAGGEEMGKERKLYSVQKTWSLAENKWEVAWAVILKETKKQYRVKPAKSSGAGYRGPSFPYHNIVPKGSGNVSLDTAGACDAEDARLQEAINRAEKTLATANTRLKDFRKWREEEGYGKNED